MRSTRHAARSRRATTSRAPRPRFELGKDEIVLRADTRHRAPSAMRDLLESKAIRRNLSLKIFDWGEIEEAGGNTVRQNDRPAPWPARRPGQEDHQAHPRRLPKVKSQIQGDAIRVSSKSKDELQKVIARLREESEGYPVPLQFQNYR